MTIEESARKKESMYRLLQRLGIDTQSIKKGDLTERELEELCLGLSHLLDDWNNKLD